jgi:Lon-like ATP-dependent protease
MPGKVIQALKITQVSNPVILIDEVDKLGRDFRGDPSSALLEVLDPEQNNAFRDLYLDVPVDLSRALFLCTANVTETIPGPLLDRMEVIRLAGYVFEEKLQIANQYLIPQTISSHGISDDVMNLNPDALAELIRNHAREAGVRQLRKLLEKIARKVALNLVRTEVEKRTLTSIGLDNLTKFVGQPPFTSDHLYPDGMPPGVCMGLAWTSMGGKTLFVEARGRVPEAPTLPKSIDSSGEVDSSQEEGKEKGGARRRPQGAGPKLKVTGKLGKVMNESSDIALTYARQFLQEVDEENCFLDEAIMHMNCPEGATPKDGPSAGVTMTSALLSLALDRPVKADLAMTGELTLTGKVLRVGGIKEKTIAARRENVGMIVLPMSNHADYMELKPHLRAGLTAHFVDHFDDIYRLAFADSGAPMPLTDSRGAEVKTIVTPVEVTPVEVTPVEGAVTDTPGPTA